MWGLSQPPQASFWRMRLLLWVPKVLAKHFPQKNFWVPYLDLNVLLTIWRANTKILRKPPPPFLLAMPILLILA
ncbi:hypothetical protein A3A70_02810 [candidate division WWE3 bacterium RIFCSPLOWO2_01_FULL_42_11]|uniref:Uncharacterized protein n=1 Tax=candidate division WWE3 bacterium RIFCSPLOWO2_01_FULL_42_11 TaxID=1802627 RepID=A0A1F4VM80_UNCKA|nr:MAG: hypothetical protein A3A70_02810 [candidate division WWE3 bacterium RIFCSPLOWO2_01_FULL_42_11]